MADKRGSKHGAKRGSTRGGAGGANTVRVRPVPGGDGWEFAHPGCARSRAEDIEEVRHMIEAGEHEIAVDELRWLLSGCGDFIDAHRLLGEIALVDGDLQLARGHFGYAYDIGRAAIEREPRAKLVPYSRPANQSFFEAGKGLAHCLQELGKTSLANEVVNVLLRLDPADPLGVQGMRALDS